MKKAKIRASLFPKPYSNGEYPIFIRIYHNAKSSYVSIGHSIPQNAWNHDKSEVWESKPSLTEKMKQSLSREEIRAFRKLQSSIILLPNAQKINSDIRAKIGDLKAFKTSYQQIRKQYHQESLKARLIRKILQKNQGRIFFFMLRKLQKGNLKEANQNK